MVTQAHVPGTDLFLTIGQLCSHSLGQPDNRKEGGATEKNVSCVVGR